MKDKIQKCLKRMMTISLYDKHSKDWLFYYVRKKDEVLDSLNSEMDWVGAKITKMLVEKTGGGS